MIDPLTLPPSVAGSAKYKLRLDVDAIVWNTKAISTPPNVKIRAKWWGDKGYGTLLRPRNQIVKDAAQDPISQPPSSVYFVIHGSLETLQRYFDDADQGLRFDVFTSDQKIIGKGAVTGLTTASLMDLFIPIYSPSRTRKKKIADLHVIIRIDPHNASSAPHTQRPSQATPATSSDSVSSKMTSLLTRASRLRDAMLRAAQSDASAAPTTPSSGPTEAPSSDPAASQAGSQVSPDDIDALGLSLLAEDITENDFAVSDVDIDEELDREVSSTSPVAVSDPPTMPASVHASTATNPVANVDISLNGDDYDAVLAVLNNPSTNDAVSTSEGDHDPPQQRVPPRPQPPPAVAIGNQPAPHGRSTRQPLFVPTPPPMFVPPHVMIGNNVIQVYLSVRDAANLPAREGATATSRDAYVVCRMLQQFVGGAAADVTASVDKSAVVPATNFPVFCFRRTVTLPCTPELLHYFHTNSVVVEVWDQRQCEDNDDELIGIVKIPLQPFYLSFRERFAELSFSYTLPIIAVNDYRALHNPITGKTSGALKILLAAGNVRQIATLRMREEEEDIVWRQKAENERRRREREEQEALRRQRQLREAEEAEKCAREREEWRRKIELEERERIRREEEERRAREAEIERKLREQEEEEEKKRRREREMEEQQRREREENERRRAEAEAEERERKRREAEDEERRKMRALEEEQHRLREQLEAVLARDMFALPNAPQNRVDVAAETDDSILEQPQEVPKERKILYIQILEARLQCVYSQSMRCQMPPSAYVTFQWDAPGDEKEFITPTIPSSTQPSWQYEVAIEVTPDKALTEYIKRHRLAFVVRNQERLDIADCSVDQQLGTAKVDLHPLLTMREIHGWYHVKDFKKQSVGQLLVRLRPDGVLGTPRTAVRELCASTFIGSPQSFSSSEEVQLRISEEQPVTVPEQKRRDSEDESDEREEFPPTIGSRTCRKLGTRRIGNRKRPAARKRVAVQTIPVSDGSACEREEKEDIEVHKDEERTENQTPQATPTVDTDETLLSAALLLEHLKQNMRDLDAVQQSLKRRLEAEEVTGASTAPCTTIRKMLGRFSDPSVERLAKIMSTSYAK